MFKLSKIWFTLFIIKKLNSSVIIKFKLELSNKVILITGASSGIGFELSKVFAAESCKLALLSRRINILNDLAEELHNKFNCKVLPIKCDVTNENEVRNAVEAVINHFQKIDIAILNSGKSGRTTTEIVSHESAKEIFDVNVWGIFNCVKEILPIFKLQGLGTFVGISSLAEKRGFPKSGIYCASKAAVSIFLESLRVELWKTNINVLTVKPGFIKTPMTEKNNFKMPFLIDANKAARIIVKGIKKEKRIIQFPFPTVLFSKLLRILPNNIFEYIASKT